MTDRFDTYVVDLDADTVTAGDNVDAAFNNNFIDLLQENFKCCGWNDQTNFLVNGNSTGRTHILQ